MLSRKALTNATSGDRQKVFEPEKAFARISREVRTGGGINGFDRAPGHEGEHRVLDRRELVQALVTGAFGTNLWDRSEVDVSPIHEYRRAVGLPRGQHPAG
ncbi:hypothetical protein [Amycolatopsis samaneae]|uniref:Uncharacterized protein n=1 Tax=Amycolatopsis samaneae TaxID=664691 RepID=A0ABW5GQH0_9PSEU